MINWFDMPAEGLSNGGLFEIKELTATENKVYQKDGEVYNKVTVNVPSPTGKITITENGTDIDIAQYATADVNVEGGGGSSDFSTAKMTVINNKEWTIQVNDCPVASVEDEMLFGGFSVNANRQSVFDVIIYKGYAHIFEMVTGVSIDTPVDLETEASLSGNAEYDAEDGLIDITGDCTITIS